MTQNTSTDAERIKLMKKARFEYLLTDSERKGLRRLRRNLSRWEILRALKQRGHAQTARVAQQKEYARIAGGLKALLRLSDEELADRIATDKASELMHQARQRQLFSTQYGALASQTIIDDLRS